MSVLKKFVFYIQFVISIVLLHKYGNNNTNNFNNNIIIE